MKYRIFENGEAINTIAGSEGFVKYYCEKYGYTFELIEEPGPGPVKPEPENSVWDELDAAYREGVDSV